MKLLFENWRKFRKESKSLLQEQEGIAGIDGHQLDMADDPRKIGYNKWKNQAMELLESSFDTSRLEIVPIERPPDGSWGSHRIRAGVTGFLPAGWKSGDRGGHVVHLVFDPDKPGAGESLRSYIKKMNIDELNQNQIYQLEHAIDELIHKLAEDHKVTITKRTKELKEEIDDIYNRMAADMDPKEFYAVHGQELDDATYRQRKERQQLQALLYEVDGDALHIEGLSGRLGRGRNLYRQAGKYYKSSLAQWAEEFRADLHAEEDPWYRGKEDPWASDPSPEHKFRGEDRPLSADLDFKRVNKVNVDIMDGVYAQILKDPDAALDRIILSEGGDAFKHAAVPGPFTAGPVELVRAREGDHRTPKIKKTMKRLEARRGGRPEIVDISDPRVESSEGIRWGSASKRVGDTRIIADDDMIREAKKIGWHKLTPEQRKKVVTRLAALELDAMYNITGTKKPIAKTIQAFEYYVEAAHEIGEELGSISEESARQADILRKTKVVRGTGFKALLKKIPFLGLLITAVAFPTDEAKAAWGRGVEIKAGLRKKYKGSENPQAEFINILIAESFRAVDPGFELGVMAATALPVAVDIIKGGFLPWLLGERTKAGLDPQTEKYNIEDYPMEYRKEKEEEEEIGPTLPPINENNKHSHKLKIIIK